MSSLEGPHLPNTSRKRAYSIRSLQARPPLSGRPRVLPAQLLPKLCERGAGSAAIFFGLFLSFLKAPCSGEPKQPGGSALSPGTVSRCLPAGQPGLLPCSGALKILQVQPARRPGGLVGRDHVEIFYKSSMLVDREVWSVLVKFLQVQHAGRPGSLVDFTSGLRWVRPTPRTTASSPAQLQ